MEFGMILAVAYLVSGLILFALHLHFHGKEGIRGRSLSPTQDPQSRLKEYDVLKEEVAKLADSMDLQGSVFVLIAFFLLGLAAATNTNPFSITLVFVALIIYSSFLFPSMSGARRLDTIAGARLSGIEEQNNFMARRYILESAKSDPWINARRFLWGFLLLVVVLSGFSIIAIIH